MCGTEKTLRFGLREAEVLTSKHVPKHQCLEEG